MYCLFIKENSNLDSVCFLAKWKKPKYLTFSIQLKVSYWYQST